MFDRETEVILNRIKRYETLNSILTIAASLALIAGIAFFGVFIIAGGRI